MNIIRNTVSKHGDKVTGFKNQSLKNEKKKSPIQYDDLWTDAIIYSFNLGQRELFSSHF